MKKILIVSIFIALFLASCGIEGFEPIIELKPPLALTAKMYSNKIRLEFWGANDETYFSGYDVYVSDTIENLKKEGKKYPNADELDNKSTIWENIQAVSVATKYTYDIDKTYDQKELVVGIDYFFYVKAFSEEYSIHSKPSNITNVRYTNE